MLWVITPAGLEFFQTIGRERPGRPSPEPFERPTDVVAIERSSGQNDTRRNRGISRAKIDIGDAEIYYEEKCGAPISAVPGVSAALSGPIRGVSTKLQDYRPRLSRCGQSTYSIGIP